MRVLVLGCGRIGTAAARELAYRMPTAEIILADINSFKGEMPPKTLGKATFHGNN